MTILTSERARDIYGGIICVAVLIHMALTASWWALGVLAFCLILT